VTPTSTLTTDTSSASVSTLSPVLLDDDHQRGLDRHGDGRQRRVAALEVLVVDRRVRLCACDGERGTLSAFIDSLSSGLR
jgi:hypothetical protein